MKPTFSYWTKALFVFIASILGGLNLLMTGAIGFLDLTQGQYLGIFTVAFVLAGGILGLQEAPSQIASSSRG